MEKTVWNRIASAAVVPAVLLLVSTAATATATAQNQPNNNLDAALASVGADRETFAAEAHLADTLIAAEDDIEARYPGAVTELRMNGQHGEVVLSDTCADTAEACAIARRHGVTPVIDEAQVRSAQPTSRGTFAPAQSAGSLGSLAPTDNTATPPADTTLPAGSMYFAGQLGNSCSLGANATMGDAYVNITAAHCATDRNSHAFTPATVTDGRTHTTLGSLQSPHYDLDIDYAVIVGNDEFGDRLNTNGVAGTESMPTTITGWQRPITGQLVCKTGARSGVTCGRVAGPAEDFDTGQARPDTKTVYDLCVLQGDSGGLFFTNNRALGIVSVSNVADQPSCTAAARNANARGYTMSAVGPDLSDILALEPQMQLITS